MLILQKAFYLHPNKDVLFEDIDFTVNKQDKIALAGNNGSGKSTLLRIIAGELSLSGGVMQRFEQPYFVPQLYGQFDHLSIAQALGVANKLNALQEILAGKTTAENFTALDDDWSIEERCKEALHYWELDTIDLSQKMGSLSGGEKTKVFLAGIIVHQPAFILLDEPSNHLDRNSRQLLYDLIEKTTSTLLVVSHDKELLGLLHTIAELDKNGITIYGGNYSFYAAQKELQAKALEEDIHSKEKEIRKAKEKERETKERQQRMDARGKGKQEKAGMARIMMNTYRNKAENSTAKLKGVHAEKIGNLSGELQALRSSVIDPAKMKMGLDKPALQHRKLLFKAGALNIAFTGNRIWKDDLDFEIHAGERIAIKGNNGSGKTSLLQIICGNRQPQKGTVYHTDTSSFYIDQDYSLLHDQLTVYEQVQLYNENGLAEYEVKSRLNRFLFGKESWGKKVAALSGGERMRLLLSALTILPQSPGILFLDEPTNNLDIQNTAILAAAIHAYEGTVIVVSHDDHFLEEIRIEREINLER